MSIDASRYALITQEYRYADVYMGGIAAAYAKARELEVGTVLTSVDRAQDTATAISGLVSTPKRRFEVVITGTDTVSIDSFLPVTPTIALSVPELTFNGNVVLTRLRIMEDDDVVVMELWG